MYSASQASWRNPKILLTVLLIFLCGSMAGALAMRYRVYPARHQTAPYWTESGKQIYLQRIVLELNLTQDQARQVEQILDDFVKYYHSLQAQMDEMRADGKAKILQILDEEQKKKFEGMLLELQDKRPQIR